MGMIGYTPVKPPFKHCECLIARQGLERNVAIQIELHLWANPASYSRNRPYTHMEISKSAGLFQGKIAIEHCQLIRDLRQM